MNNEIEQACVQRCIYIYYYYHYIRNVSVDLCLFMIFILTQFLHFLMLEHYSFLYMMMYLYIDIQGVPKFRILLITSCVTYGTPCLIL